MRKQNNDLNLTTSSRIGLIAIIALVLGVISGIVWGGFLIIRMLWRWIQGAVYTISAMDTVIIIALISGAITIVGLLVNSLLSLYIKNSEAQYRRKVMLLRKLEIPYTQFVNLIFDMLKKKEDVEKIDNDVISLLTREMSREIILYGSDKVVQKWASYRKKAPIFTREDHLTYIEDILHLIRQDMGIKRGKLKSGDLLSLFVNDVQRFEDFDRRLEIGGLSFGWNTIKAEDTIDEDLPEN